MDVLFVNTIDFLSTNSTPPLGLYSLAGVLKRETKLQTDVVNFDYLNAIGRFVYSDNIDENIENMALYLSAYHSKVVDFYTMCNSYAVTLCLAERLKELDEEVVITFGGPQASLCAEESLKNFTFIELIGIGEGELYISDLMQRLVSGEDYSDIQGIAYRNNGCVSISRCSKMISGEQLGSYASFDYELDGLDFSKIKYFPLEAGRGCPFGCTFCSTSIFWGRKFRIKPIDQIIKEMDIINSKYGITSFSLEHDMFTVNKEYLMNFCEKMIAERPQYTWGCSSRVDALDEESLLMMKRAGCTSIYMGIETGSQQFQYVVNKNLKLNDAVRKISLIKKYGFDLTVSFIYGFPDETEENFRETMEMIQKLIINDVNNTQLHLFIPLPNTLETNKINDIVYFDPSQIELSVYSSNRFNARLHQMILDYKKVFIQYYTFDSIVRKKYVRMDFLLGAFVLSKSILGYSVKTVLKRTSLIDIYNRYVELIEKTNEMVSNICVSESFTGATRFSYITDMMADIIDKEIKKESDSSTLCVYNFEKSILEYIKGKMDSPQIIHSKYNVLDIIKGKNVLEQETYISITKTPFGVNLKQIEVSQEVADLVAG